MCKAVFAQLPNSLSSDAVSVSSGSNFCREEVNQVLEKARGERFIGSALEAKVVLHVADAELAQSLQGLQGVGRCIPC